MLALTGQLRTRRPEKSDQQTRVRLMAIITIAAIFGSTGWSQQFRAQQDPQRAELHGLSSDAVYVSPVK